MEVVRMSACERNFERASRGQCSLPHAASETRLGRWTLFHFRFLSEDSYVTNFPYVSNIAIGSSHCKIAGDVGELINYAVFRVSDSAFTRHYSSVYQ